MKEYYESVQDTQFEVTTRNLKVLKAATSIVSKYISPKILDIGCGCGYYGKGLREFRKSSWMVGIDCLDSLKDTYNLYLKADLNFKDEMAVLENRLMSDKNRSFDLIICSEVLEHLFNPELVYPFMKNLLHESGSIIITTPNFDWDNRSKNPCELLYNEQIPWIKQHIRQFNLGVHSKYLHENGLKIVEIFGADSEYCGYTNEIINSILEEYPTLDRTKLHEAFQKAHPKTQKTLCLIAKHA